MAREEKKGIGDLSLTKIAVLLAIAGLLVVCAVSISNIFKLHREQDALREQNEKLQEEKASLETELENVNDLDYIEEQARKLLKMIKPGEVMFILDESGMPHVVEPDEKGELPKLDDPGIISGETQEEYTESEYIEPEYSEEIYQEETTEQYQEEVPEEITEEVTPEPEAEAQEEYVEPEYSQEPAAEEQAEYIEEPVYEETTESSEEGTQG